MGASFPLQKWVLREIGLFVLFSLVLGCALTAAILYFLSCFYSRRLEAPFIYFLWLGGSNYTLSIACRPSLGWISFYLLIFGALPVVLCCEGQVGASVSYDITTCISSWPSSAPRLYLGGINVLDFFLRWYMLCERGVWPLGCVSSGYRLLLDLKVYWVGGLDLFLSLSLVLSSRCWITGCFTNM